MNAVSHPGAAGRAGSPRLDPKQYRQCLSRFATGVTVVSFLGDDGPHGLTVNSFTSVSLDPPLVLVCLDRKSKAADRLRARDFAVNILSAEQEHLAWHFAGDKRVETVDWADRDGVPVLYGTLARIWCTPERRQRIGDHYLLVGQVTRFQSVELDALTFFGGRFARLPNPAPA